MSVNNVHEYAPASCNKKSAEKMVMFHRPKKLRFQNFLAFYRKIFRAENILDRIKTRSKLVGVLNGLDLCCPLYS